MVLESLILKHCGYTYNCKILEGGEKGLIIWIFFGGVGRGNSFEFGLH